MALDRWDACFLVSKMKILDRSEPLSSGYEVGKSGRNRTRQSSFVHAKTPTRRNFLPIKSEKMVRHETQNLIANNYLKGKQMGDSSRKKRKLKRPMMFPDAYTNRAVLQIPCFTFPRYF